MSSWRSSPTSERLTVARVLRAKGLTGGMRVELLTDFPERLAEGASLYLDGEATVRSVTKVELGGKVPVVYLSGITNRHGAEAMAGRYLEADAHGLPEGSYYWHQLEGLRVLDQDGNQIGTLAEVFRAGGNEVYRVVGGERDRLVPALRSVVVGIDLDAGTMTVRDEDAEEVR